MNSPPDKNKLLALPGTWRPLLWLAVPVMGEQLLTIGVGYTDWWLCGNLLKGTEYKAAMGLMAYALWMLSCLFTGISIGTTALVSRFVGAGDRELARRTMHQALLLGLVAGVTMIGIASQGLDGFLFWMNVPADALPHAREYLSIVIPTVPMVVLGQIAAATLNGAGDTRIGFVSRVVVVLANAVMSAGLASGWGPFPNLGWAGLAYGTACGYVVGPLVGVGALFAGRAGMKLRLRELRPDFQLMRRLLRIGIPGGCDVLAMLFCQLVYVSVINSLGTAAAAAHGLGLQIEALAYLTGHAFQIATSTMTGQLLGAGDSPRAARAVRTGCTLAGVLMTGAGALFVLFGEPLASFFTGGQDQDTVAGAVMYLRIVSLTMPSLAVLIVMTGALRGAGDTVWPFVLGLIGQLVFRVGLGAILAFDVCRVPLTDITFPGAGLGVVGAWWGMAADVIVRSVLVTLRFLQGGWRKIHV